MTSQPVNSRYSSHCSPISPLSFETYLDEPDILRLFSEALTANVEAILSNETGGVGADTAISHHTTDQSLSIGSLLDYAFGAD